MADKSDNKKRLLKALESSLGVVTVACKKANISRDTHYRWLKEDEEYQKAVYDIENIALDFAESQLHSEIADKNTTAIIFYLKTKGKRRGYVEKYESDIQHTSHSEIKLTDEQLDKLMNREI